uniref:Uncharacterized protein n=1 Tax=Trypanosoma vivax (strain Y486) TaxID=1055687 RepID=G0U7F3_TRYVY|nr:hypothetical protein, unlikely [Trypanosoma vivax Y486]
MKTDREQRNDGKHVSTIETLATEKKKKKKKLIPIASQLERGRRHDALHIFSTYCKKLNKAATARFHFSGLSPQPIHQRAALLLGGSHQRGKCKPPPNSKTSLPSHPFALL